MVQFNPTPMGGPRFQKKTPERDGNIPSPDPDGIIGQEKFPVLHRELAAPILMRADGSMKYDI
jgi:hypothetical protein